MCGIGGILRVWPQDQRELALRTPHGESIPEAWLDVLDDSIRHRGPDGHGRFRDRAIRADGCVVDVAFVHRRLSIIDHAGGHQPMVWVGGPALRAGRLLSPLEIESHNATVLRSATLGSESRATNVRVAVVFNGCIYNHRELRAELQRAGHVFTTDHSDTEVLVHGWREWREKMCVELDGMFAFTVWCGASGIAFLGRDRAGEKPFHLATIMRGESEITAFASTAGASMRATRAMGAQNEQHNCGKHIASWIRLGFGPGVPSEYASQVAPACQVLVDRHPLQIVPYEPIPTVPVPTIPTRRTPLSVDELDRLLQTAVESRLVADVPLGGFLSGGVDSSLICMMVRRSAGRLRTFTVRMPDHRYDESGFADAASRTIGSEHSVLDCEADPASDVSRLIEQIGLPLGDSSLLPSYWLARAARREVAVAIGGDGGDDLFAGYERHTAARLLAWPWRLALMPLAGLGRDADPRSRSSKLRRMGSAAANDGYVDLLSIFPTPDLRRIGQSTTSPIRRRWNGGGTAGALLIDRWYYLPYDLMTKTDSATMSVALELRSPLLANTVMQRAMQAPISSLMPRGQRKGLLRAVARKYLPSEIVDRPKMGFAIPIGEWFRTDYGGLRTMLLDHVNSTEPFGPPSLGIDLNMKFIRQILDEHLGTGPSGRVKRDHSQRLYMLLVLSIWAKWLGSLR